MTVSSPPRAVQRVTLRRVGPPATPALLVSLSLALALAAGPSSGRSDPARGSDPAVDPPPPAPHADAPEPSRSAGFARALIRRTVEVLGGRAALQQTLDGHCRARLVPGNAGERNAGETGAPAPDGEVGDEVVRPTATVEWWTAADGSRRVDRIVGGLVETTVTGPRGSWRRTADGAVTPLPRGWARERGVACDLVPLLLAPSEGARYLGRSSAPAPPTAGAAAPGGAGAAATRALDRIALPRPGATGVATGAGSTPPELTPLAPGAVRWSRECLLELDADTGRPARLRLLAPRPGSPGELQVTLEFHDFRRVSGALLPHRLEVHAEAAARFSVVLDEISVGTPPPASTFAPPPPPARAGSPRGGR